MPEKCEVYLSKLAEKQLRRLPKYIQEAVFVWAASVEKEGIRNVRRLPGYHDEPLKGNRRGQRSIRLSRSYRLIYEETSQSPVLTILVIEVNKHDY